ncbi:MAG: MFS transporter [Pseudomonadota bacterium]
MPERAIIFLALAQTLIWASASYIFPALLLWWEADLGWTRGELTGAITVALLVSAACSPIAGQLIDRGHGAALMGASTFLAGMFVGSLSLVEQIWQFYLVWIFIGIMISGCLYEPCFALITRARGLRGRPDIVAITLVAGFASTISFPLANALAEAYGWRSAVQVFCVIATLIAAPLMYIGAREIEATKTEPTPKKQNAPVSSLNRQFLTRPEFWFLGLAFACGSLLQQITIHHQLAIFEDRNVSRDVAILAASFIGPMQVAGRLAMVAAGSRASNHVVAILSFTAMGTSILMLMFSGTAVGFIAAYAILFGAAHGVVSIIRPGLAYEILGKENFGSKSGYLASLFFMGGAIAPFSGSLIWQAGGYDTVLTFLIGLAVLGLFLYVLANMASKK